MSQTVTINLMPFIYFLSMGIVVALGVFCGRRIGRLYLKMRAGRSLFHNPPAVCTPGCPDPSPCKCDLCKDTGFIRTKVNILKNGRLKKQKVEIPCSCLVRRQWATKMQVVTESPKPVATNLNEGF